MSVIASNGRPMLVTEGGQPAKFAEILEWGFHLANTPVGIKESADAGSHKLLWQAKGWKEFVSGMPEHKQATTAIMLENCRATFGRMDEVTRTQALGSFDKWIFPVIANMAENDVIDQIVALQPMSGPTSQVVYMDIVTETAKGQVPGGTPFWRAIQGAADRFGDSDELIQNETYTTDGSGNFNVTLAWLPVRPGTVQITQAGVTTMDDGNGGIVASAPFNAGGTINYNTGVVVLSTSGAAAATTATYAFNSEANLTIQGYEMRLSAVPVTAKVLKLRTLWSEEAEQNLQAMFNIKMESTMINALTAGLQYQKHRSVIADIRARAQAGTVSWDATPPANVNYQTHKFSFVDAVVTGSNLILGATNMVSGNWIILGLQAATVVQTLPQFQAKGNLQETQGISYIGDMSGFKCFRDPHYPQSEFMIGYKGDQFVRTGYVLAEWQKLYTTPDIVLTDFVHRRGFATSFAKHCINAGMFCRGSVLNAPVSFGTTFG
jgi:hypothetical protein